MTHAESNANLSLVATLAEKLHGFAIGQKQVMGGLVGLSVIADTRRVGTKMEKR
jgi:hypothetical protein